MKIDGTVLIYLVSPNNPTGSLAPSGSVAASEALRDHAFFKRSFDENQAAKRMVYEAMDKSGLGYIPSEGNFILHETGMDLEVYQRAMLARHIRVGRDMGTGRGRNRLSMGTVGEMAYILEQFRQLHR